MCLCVSVSLLVGWLVGWFYSLSTLVWFGQFDNNGFQLHTAQERQTDRQRKKVRETCSEIIGQNLSKFLTEINWYHSLFIIASSTSLHNGPNFGCHYLERERCLILKYEDNDVNKESRIHVFTDSSAPAGDDARSISKVSLTGLNLELSFSLTGGYTKFK